MGLLIAFFVLVLLYSAVSARLDRSPVTAPMVFTAGGILAGWWATESLVVADDREVFLPIAEIGLSLLLFADASHTDLRLLRRIGSLPARLLSVGMLLTILLGAVFALALLPGLTVWEAGVLAAILAPTDAGLGQVIVTSPRVPRRIAQALNVEAGLNDGLAVPFLLFFIACAGTPTGDSSLVGFVWEQLGLGTLVGCGIGLAGGGILGWSARRGWLARPWSPLGIVAIPLLCVLASEALGASMFIAAFVAGLAVQVRHRAAATHALEFAEGWGQLLNLAVFFLFGCVVPTLPFPPDLAVIVYATLSLTVVRMLPVALALWGTRSGLPTVLFVGWFGPRGLASIVLGLVYLEEVALDGGEPTIRLAVVATVLSSIFAHGLSARPGIAWYERARPHTPRIE